jgi:hypothetical protein
VYDIGDIPTLVFVPYYIAFEEILNGLNRKDKLEGSCSDAEMPYAAGPLIPYKRTVLAISA